MKNLCRPVFLPFFLPLLFTGCQKGAKVERTTENGVEVVINHAQPVKMKSEESLLTLEKQFVIDFESEKLAKVGPKEVAGFDVDSKGNIYV